MTVYPLTEGQDAEVLTFLAARPLHTVYMAGLIRDNGLVSPLNRGTFHACRDAGGRLAGVALIGHVTMFEALDDAALGAFARLAQGYPAANVIVGEHAKLEAFWGYYAGGGQAPRLRRHELLLEQRPSREAGEPVPGLRRARPEDLPLLLPAQAEMALAEAGVNPLERDLAGFTERYARRVERGRVWLVADGGQLLFKADVMADTPEAAYLEGVYVHPRERAKGHGLRCLLQLGRALLEGSRSICLLVDEENRKARALYYRAGYRLRAFYDAIYLQPRGN